MKKTKDGSARGGLSVKATYSLDVETVRKLEEMARRWGVSKSEALRRAIHVAAGETTGSDSPAIRALDALQRSLAMDPIKARRWVAASASERRSVSSRAARRGR